MYVVEFQCYETVNLCHEADGVLETLKGPEERLLHSVPAHAARQTSDRRAADTTFCPNHAALLYDGQTHLEAPSLLKKPE